MFMDGAYSNGDRRQLVVKEKVRRRLLMQLADARDMMGYVEGERRETRQALLEANRWLRTNPDDWRVLEARDRLREAALPAMLLTQ